MDDVTRLRRGGMAWYEGELLPLDVTRCSRIRPTSCCRART